VRSDDGDVRVCQLDNEVECTRDSDCGSEDQVCAPDGECRDTCSKKSQCADEQVCVEGSEVCAAEDELDEDGELPVISLTASGIGPVGPASTDGGPQTVGPSGGIGAGGGVLVTTDARIEIPEDALSDTENIAANTATPPVELPMEWSPLSAVVAVTPHGLTFDKAIRIAIPYDEEGGNTQVAILDDESDDEWELLDAVTFAGSTATFERTSLSFYVVVDAAISVDVEQACNNGVQDDIEPGTDCGGPCPDKCPDSSTCDQASDCQSGVCDVICQAASCGDGVINGTETDTDCGGDACLTRCANGMACAQGTDCESHICTNGTCAPLNCPSEAGVASMVALPAGFCIDSTEVTRAQYAAWLASSPDTSNQPEGCEDNVFSPDPLCLQNAFCRTDCGDHPQVCVDWCDAKAYCAAVGKRLCGAVDPTVTEFDPNSVASQWYYACSSAGTHLFTYGGQFDAAACENGGATIPVGTLDTCQSPEPSFAGIFDMSCHVAEWTDHCVDGSCLRRGDALGNPAGACAYEDADMAPITRAETIVGLRCCSL
jgi:hypothetical protein